MSKNYKNDRKLVYIKKLCLVQWMWQISIQMVPQVEGVLSLKKMLDYFKLKQVGGLKVETIIRLSRFVVQNNYFSYNG